MGSFWAQNKDGFKNVKWQFLFLTAAIQIRAGQVRRLTAKSEVAVVMTTCCHPSTLAFQSFTALEQPSWLPHGRHLEPGAPPGAFKTFLADEDPTTGDHPDCCPMPPSSSACVSCTGGFC